MHDKEREDRPERDNAKAKRENERKATECDGDDRGTEHEADNAHDEVHQ